jgi:hypothetical protein
MISWSKVLGCFAIVLIRGSLPGQFGARSVEVKLSLLAGSSRSDVRSGCQSHGVKSES